MIKAVLTSPGHPEYGEVTVPFPIPDVDYDHAMELLGGLGIGDALAQDCRVTELDSLYPVLDRLKGTAVNADELDYLARRLDGFCEGENDQFLAMAHKLDLSDIKDFINLTFCCQPATVITGFSNLEQIGRDHCMNIHGGAMSTEEYAKVDGRAEAMRLIQSGQGTVTPYGVVYDNGMELQPLYDGRHFPSYLYKPSVMAIEAVSDNAAGCFCLPMPDQQLQRMTERAGLEAQNIPLKVALDELPEKAADALDLEGLTLDDLPGLNRLCRAIDPMKDADMEKLNAVVLMAEPEDVMAVCQLAESLDKFDFIPGVQTAEEYGRYMIQKSGRFEYDPNLEGIYNYRAYGEQRIQAEGGSFNECGYVSYHGVMTLEELMREEPAEQYRRETGMQML